MTCLVASCNTKDDQQPLAESLHQMGGSTFYSDHRFLNDERYYIQDGASSMDNHKIYGIANNAMEISNDHEAIQ